jgi:hypothetical protein
MFHPNCYNAESDDALLEYFISRKPTRPAKVYSGKPRAVVASVPVVAPVSLVAEDWDLIFPSVVPSAVPVPAPVPQVPQPLVPVKCDNAESDDALLQHFISRKRTRPSKVYSGKPRAPVVAPVPVVAPEPVPPLAEDWDLIFPSVVPSAVIPVATPVPQVPQPLVTVEFTVHVPPAASVPAHPVASSLAEELEKLRNCRAKLIRKAEKKNPRLLGETNELWEALCRKKFPRQMEYIEEPEPYDTWQDVYHRLKDERKQRQLARKEGSCARTRIYVRKADR